MSSIILLLQKLMQPKNTQVLPNENERSEKRRLPVKTKISFDETPQTACSEFSSKYENIFYFNQNLVKISIITFKKN